MSVEKMAKKTTMRPTRKETPLSKAAAKKAVAPIVSKKPAVIPAKPKAEKVAKEPRVRKDTAKSLIAEMLLEKKFTDNEIEQAVSEKFQENFKRAYISITRADINSGRLHKGISEGKLPLVALFKDEKGKFVDKPAPKSEQKEKGVAILKKVALSLPKK
jgi:hypothetical protein